MFRVTYVIGRYSRNADFISIAAKGGYPQLSEPSEPGPRSGPFYISISPWGVYNKNTILLIQSSMEAKGRPFRGGRMKEETMKAKGRFIFAMMIFGTLGIFIRYIPLPSTVIAEARGILATLFLLLVVFLRHSSISREAVKRNFKFLFLSGAAIGVNWILLFEAYRYTTVSTATLSYYMAPVFVILASPFVVKERLTAVKFLCALSAFAGMVLISGVLTEPGEGVTFKGIGFGLGAAAFYASVMLLNQFLKDISAYDMTITQLGLASLVLLPYTLFTENLSALPWAPLTVILLLTVGIVHTGITYTLYFGSMAGLHAQTAALFSYIDPIVAIILSACWLGEPLGGAGLAGAILILGSTVVSTFLDTPSA